MVWGDVMKLPELPVCRAQICERRGGINHYASAWAVLRCVRCWLKAPIRALGVRAGGRAVGIGIENGKPVRKHLALLRSRERLQGAHTSQMLHGA